MHKVIDHCLINLIHRDKVIFHDYGHGDAAVSLAPGCAKMSVFSFERCFDKSTASEVAVLGSGYLGLFTAKILIERGFNVTIYSREFPYEKPVGAC